MNRLIGWRSVGVLLMGIAVVPLAGQGTARPEAPGPAAPPGMQTPAPGTGRGAAAPAPAPNPAAVARATEVLAATRQAMGGEKLAAVKTLVATGQTKRVRGDNLVPIEFEINIELPDKYMRKDEFPAEESDPTSTGFNGDLLIQLPVAPARPPMPAGRAGGPPAPTPEMMEAQRKARVATLKQDFVRFALGMFADTFQTYPLTFAFAAVAEAPQGKADVLDVRGANNFAARLFVNSQTRLPIMISWNLPPTNVIVTVPGRPQPPSIAPGAVVVVGPPAPDDSADAAAKEAYAKQVVALRQKAQTTLVEHRIYYQDYRDVEGVMLPFRLRRAIGTDTTEETIVDRYRINSRIAPQKFAVEK